MLASVAKDYRNSSYGASFEVRREPSGDPARREFPHVCLKNPRGLNGGDGVLTPAGVRTDPSRMLQ